VNSDRRGYRTFEPLPPTIDPDEIYELSMQALKDVADIELMGDVLEAVSRDLQMADDRVTWRLRRPEEAYATDIDVVLFARGRPHRLERRAEARSGEVDRARLIVERFGGSQVDTLQQLSYALTEYGSVLHQLQRYDEAADCFAEVIEISKHFSTKEPAISAYNRACALAKGGRTDEAIEQLRRAIDRDLSSGSEDLTEEWVTEDGDLDSLRDDPRYKALIQKRYGAQAEPARDPARPEKRPPVSPSDAK
jgi:tetratricopeptide (TPR) repeat protein